jgi:hypothetical protein
MSKERGADQSTERGNLLETLMTFGRGRSGPPPATPAPTPTTMPASAAPGYVIPSRRTKKTSTAWADKQLKRLAAHKRTSQAEAAGKPVVTALSLRAAYGVTATQRQGALPNRR